MGILCYLFIVNLFFWPHGDLQFRIDEISESITQYPDSLDLYLSRGELYLQHDEPVLAQRDFTFCLQHGLSNTYVLEGLSKSFNSATKLDSCLFYINLALDKDSTNTSAREWKARVLFLLKQYCESGQCYEDLILHVSSPSPSLFIDAADSWMQCSEASGYQHAIDLLKSGLDRVGPLHVLQKELVRDYLLHQDYTNALVVQTELIEHAINKAIPLYDRAIIYQAADQKGKAIDDLQNALFLLDHLSENKKNLPAMIELKLKMESLLNLLQG